MNKKIIALLSLLALVLCLAACQPGAPTVPSTTTKPPLAENCQHADADKNDLCDLCEGSVLISLDFFSINDLHGRFSDTEDQPGVDELSTYLISQSENTILLSSGDMWQGSFESNLTNGALITEWMNAMGFVSMALGNHEFDWGEDRIIANAELADFPFLAINIYDRDTEELVDYCQPSVMVERSGIQIGIIGAIGDVYSSISGEHTKDIFFKTGNDLTALVKAEAARLRQQGADIIVLSHHSGSTDYAITDGSVDLVFEGHSHSRYEKQDIYGVYHLQGGAENDGIAHAEVIYNIVTDEITRTNASFVSNSIYSRSEDHPIVENLMTKYEEQIAVGYKVVGTLPSRLSGTRISNLVAELYYQEGLSRWADTYDIVMGGGHIATRNPYNLDAGEVRYSDIYSLLPFDNQIALCSIRGQDLMDRFFGTSNKKYTIYYEEAGEDFLQGFEPDGTYYIITDSYTYSYASNNLTVVELYDAGVYSRDLLADYIAAGNLNEQIPTPTDIPSLLEIGNALQPGETTAESYCVKGTVISIDNTTYGNLTIQDENGNTLYIYGVYDATGSERYDQMENPPQVGDEVVLYGKIQHYVSKSGKITIEMVYARKMN